MQLKNFLNNNFFQNNSFECQKKITMSISSTWMLLFEICAPVFMKCLFPNIHKQWDILKNSLLFMKSTNFTGKELENSLD